MRDELPAEPYVVLGIYDPKTDQQLPGPGGEIYLPVAALEGLLERVADLQQRVTYLEECRLRVIREGG